jgi:hypothetical protein
VCDLMKRKVGRCIVFWPALTARADVAARYVNGCTVR